VSSLSPELLYDIPAACACTNLIYARYGFRHGAGGRLSASPRLPSLRAKQTVAMNTFVIESYHIALYIGMK